MKRSRLHYKLKIVDMKKNKTHLIIRLKDREGNKRDYFMRYKKMEITGKHMKRKQINRIRSITEKMSLSHYRNL